MKLPVLLFKLMLSAALLTPFAAHSAVATFDDLPLLPSLDSSRGISFANNDSLSYAGVIWDSRFTVVGDEYKVSSGPSDPLFGFPHSPHYFVTNQGGVNGLIITTPLILTEAWFGRNQYYGFGNGGSDQITIVALSGSTELASVVFDLPLGQPGQAGPISRVDTSSFASLTGITGYRIDRRELGDLNGSWVADDFKFEPVPIPPAIALFGSAVALLGWRVKGRPTST